MAVQPLDNLGEIRVPEWVPRLDEGIVEVSFGPGAEESLRKLGGTLIMDGEALRHSLVQSLRSDPRPLYRWKREQKVEGSLADYDIHVDGVVARCRFESSINGPTTVMVTNIIPCAEHDGYPRY